MGVIIAGDPDFGPPGRFDFSYEHIMRSAETSLQRLQTDRIDILTLHRPDLLVEHEEVARAVDELHASGKVRYFAVSNHTRGQIELLQRYVNQPLIINQLELSLLHHHLISEGVLADMTGYDYAGAQGTMDFCRLNDITVQAWSPVARGKLFARHDGATIEEKAIAQHIAELAKEHETTDEAIALAWLLRHPAGIQPVIGTLNPDRITQSVPADEVELSRKEWYALLETARGEAVP